MAKQIIYKAQECTLRMSATEDALFVIGGKWTLRVMIALLGGYRRFNELQRTITGISARVLSGELKDLEINGLLERVVLADQKPVVVEYVPTEYSKSLQHIIAALGDWGEQHKKRIKGGK
jgi:DNA-binding HxlR family transcriptional regulator